MSGASLYSADTSSLISSLNSFYRQTNFPNLWGLVDSLVDAGRFIISEEVAEEIKEHDDLASQWVEPRRDQIVVPTDGEVTNAVKVILGRFPALVKQMKNRNRADSFVIAVAQLRHGVVVTEENAHGSVGRPKIPLICRELGVDCITFYELIQSEGWTF